jgi:hypothetical protein
MKVRQGRPPLPKNQRLITVQIKVSPATLEAAKFFRRKLKLKSLSAAFRRMLGDSEKIPDEGVDS